MDAADRNAYFSGQYQGGLSQNRQNEMSTRISGLHSRSPTFFLKGKAPRELDLRKASIFLTVSETYHVDSRERGTCTVRYGKVHIHVETHTGIIIVAAVTEFAVLSFIAFISPVNPARTRTS